MYILLRIAVTTVALWIVTLLPLHVSVAGGNDSGWSRVLVFLGVGAILVGVNALVKPIVNIVTLPLRFLTLGLFSLVVNWAMLELTAWFTSKLSFGELDLGGFWVTVLAALVIAIITVILGAGAKKRHR